MDIALYRYLIVVAFQFFMTGAAGAFDGNELVSKIELAIASDDAGALRALQANRSLLLDLEDEGAPFLIHRASRLSGGAIIETLLDMGADIEAADARGYTPLMLALEAGNAEAAYLLKIRGANLAAQAHDGTTAEYLAAIVGLSGFDFPDSASAPALEKAEADAMLLLAAELGDADTVRLALAAGADPGVRAANGWSAMMLASLGSYQEALSLIVDALNAESPDAAQADARRSVDEISLDPVQAALIGQGGAEPDHARVEAIVRYLAPALYPRRSNVDRFQNYTRTAHQIGYDASFLYSAFEVGRVFSHPPGYRPPPQRPDWFLPALEYGLPIGPASDPNGWRSVQTILREEELYNGPVDGIPGEGTLIALMAYLEPLEKLLRSRAEEAKTRADEEEAVAHRSGSGARYARWDRPQQGGIYFGELLFREDATVTPFGYTVEVRSGSPNSFFYYGPQGALDAPVCDLFHVGDDGMHWTLGCKLLDGHVRVGSDPSEVRTVFSRDDVDVASFAVSR